MPPPHAAEYVNRGLGLAEMWLGPRASGAICMWLLALVFMFSCSYLVLPRLARWDMQLFSG